MNTILKLITLSLFISSANAASLYPTVSLFNDGAKKQLHMGRDDGEFSFITTSQLAVSTTIAANPVAGLIVFADSNQVMLDLENDNVLEVLENIQISLSEGLELTDLEKAILKIGLENNQINVNATIK